MAERLLETRLAEQKIKGFAVYSAGLAAKNGDSINPKSAQVLQEHGIAVDEFQSTLLKQRVLKDAFAVVCMTESQKDVLLDMRWQALRKANAIGEEEIPNNVYAFPELCGYEIIDPYGRDIDCYRYVYELLSAAMPSLIEKLRLKEFARQPKPRAPRTKKESVNSTLPPTNGENAPKKRGRPKKVKTAEQISLFEGENI